MRCSLIIMSATIPHPTDFDTDTEPTTNHSGSRIEYNFDCLLAREGMEFTFVDYIFEGENEFSGAVGTTMVPMHEDEFERRLAEYKDPEYSPLRHIYEEIDPQLTWGEWIESELSADGINSIVDTSYSHKYGEVVKSRCEEYELMEAENIRAIECIGGGRMFNSKDRDFTAVYDEELLRIVQDVEESGLYELEV